MPNDSRLTLPTLELLSFGWVTTATNEGTATLTLPAPVLSAGGHYAAAFTLPLPELVARGVSGRVGRAALAFPSLSVSAAGVTGRIGSGVLTLPTLALVAGGPARARLTLARPVLSASGLTGVTAGATVALPRMVLASTGTSQYAGAGTLSLRPLLEVRGVTGSVGRSANTLRAIALAARGATGVVGSASLTLPVVQLSARGLRTAIGSATLVLPALQLQATGRAVGAGSHDAYVLHLEAQALTQYDNYAFNSMTQFNGVYLGANDDGIFALAGGDDAGVAIDAVARVGVSDFGTSLLKRVLKAYVGYRADGDLELRVITDELATRSYLLHPTSAGMHGGAVKVGMGIHARYWQFEIANIDGADFTLNCIEITPNRLGRRVKESGA